MKGKPIDEEDPYMPTLYDLNQPSFKPAKRKSKLEYLDDRLQKERFRDEYFFMQKQRDAERRQVHKINFNHTEDNINGVFELNPSDMEEGSPEEEEPEYE